MSGGESMATDLPRFTITLPDDVYQSVMRYKEENQISTQSKAIQKLIRIGVDTVEKEKEAANVNQIPVYDPSERSLVASWRQANEKDRKTAASALDFEYFQQKEKEA
jgi:metal-responsive CopG/Arc/MetJ family transcriptional regulator